MGFTLLAHWLGCVWYSVVESGDTGLDVYLLDSDSSETEGLGYYYKWVLSLYSAVSMMLGNYYAVSDEVSEWWVHIVALLFGAILQAYIFGQVSNLIADYNSSNTKWNQQMSKIKEMMRDLQLPGDLQNRIHNYYDYYSKITTLSLWGLGAG